MPDIPPAVAQAWDQREGPAVLATVGSGGEPNAIYVGAVRLHGADRFVIADSAFCKTRANVLAGSRGAMVFLTKDFKAYQVKGPFEYLESGPTFDWMQSWADPRYARPVGAATLVVEEIYCGAERLL